MQYEDFQKRYPLPEETFQKLAAYHDVLLKWQKHVNLISPGTANAVWERHILDSLQLLSHIPKGKKLADIGSGAGFPGLVLAICGAGEITLIESDRKKCEFLKEVARVTGTKVSVCNARVENLKDQTFDVVTSRATAALGTLFLWSLPLLKKDSICLFHKGENYAIEIEEAKKTFTFDIEVLPSSSSASGCIIKTTNLTRLP